MAKRSAKKAAAPAPRPLKKAKSAPGVPTNPNGTLKIPFSFHPRVFESLGSDLVTSDLVAITELAKNSYDAHATQVHIRFLRDAERGLYLEISDDGVGMSLQIIKEVWTVVATPNRKSTPVSILEGNARRASGEKGLGRLSVARLGDELVMATKMRGKPLVTATVRWSAFSDAAAMSDCVVELTEGGRDALIASHGTVLRIYDLRSEWDDEQFAELRDYLSRLISPFQDKDTFQVWLHNSEANSDSEQIQGAPFLDSPKYRIAGTFSAAGTLSMKYTHTPIGNTTPARTEPLSLSWSEVCHSMGIAPQDLPPRAIAPKVAFRTGLAPSKRRSSRRAAVDS